MHARSRTFTDYTSDTVFILDDPSALRNRIARFAFLLREPLTQGTWWDLSTEAHKFLFEMHWNVESKIAWQLPNSDLHCQCWQEEPAYQGTTRPRRREL